MLTYWSLTPVKEKSLGSLTFKKYKHKWEMILVGIHITQRVDVPIPEGHLGGVDPVSR